MALTPPAAKRFNQQIGTHRRLWAPLTLVLALCCAWMVAWSPAASADPLALALTVDDASRSAGELQIDGHVRASDQSTPGGLIIELSVNGDSVGLVTTGADGSYSYTAVLPHPNVYEFNIIADWAGDTRYSAAQGSLQLTVCQPAMTLALDPAEANPGMVVAVAGSLLCGQTPITAAIVDLVSSYGDVDSFVSTGDDGSFSASLAIPEAETFPAGYSIQANFAGDAVYPATAQEAAGSLVAAPEPEPTVAPSTSAPAQPTSQPEVVDNQQGSQSTASPVVPVDWSPLALLCLAVALLAAITMVILLAVAHHSKRLGSGERRGFGTDFGQHGAS
ncbi:MAG: hypothetical protein LBV30_10175 [Propionibacteriaceae bacterium]|nr:hypothetical protein [Propionibacteriaceae bacterium]